MLAALLWMLATTICSPQVVAYFYVPAGSVALACPLRFRALDTATGKLLGEQEINLAEGPQQVTLNSGVASGACGRVRLAVTRVLDNGCVESSGINPNAGNSETLLAESDATPVCQKAGFVCQKISDSEGAIACVCVQIPSH